MKTNRSTAVCLSVMAVLAACSSGTTTAEVGPSQAGSSAEVSPTPPTVVQRRPLLYFEGDVDVANQTVTLTTRAPSGELTAMEKLPSGEGAGDVYFHTCP